MNTEDVLLSLMAMSTLIGWGLFISLQSEINTRPEPVAVADTVWVLYTGSDFEGACAFLRGGGVDEEGAR
ncbi:MAG: hypothetical protein EA398_16220 [Deltaproteobacteria bacterium]|nr:MAG: hypothetical protein EA398_16220 [Deltaproteobacteria bacterium]